MQWYVPHYTHLKNVAQRSESMCLNASHPVARQAQETQDSLNAQVRSWKAKAEAAEKRAAEERDKRRRLEAGAKGALAQVMT